jgi:hypothetical protein
LLLVRWGEMSISKPKLAATNVRAFTEEHVPEVSELHRKVFQTAAHPSVEVAAEYRAYFEEVFLKPSVWGRESGSLVYCEGGRVVGFLGMGQRPVVWNGERLLAGVSSQFMVEPGCRGRPGVELLRAFFQGPHDISIADESSASARRLWEAMGGVTSLVHSEQWVCPLRPFRLAASLAAGAGGAKAVLARFGRPAAFALDALARCIPGHPAGAAPSTLMGEDLDPEKLSSCISELALPLRPGYNPPQIRWLLDRARNMKARGRLRKVLLRSEEGQPAGWYIYHANPRGFSDVLELFAVRGNTEAVIDHMVSSAREQGLPALRGRTEPALLDALAGRKWPRFGGPWVQVHSRRPELSAAFQRGDAFFSRLDGEWCMHFR